MKKITYFIFLLLLFSCQNEYGSIDNMGLSNGVKTAELSPNDSIVYPLSSAVSHLITAFDYNPDNGVFSLYAADTIFSYKKGELYRKTYVPEFINTFSSKKDYFLAINYDGRSLFCIDSTGRIIKKNRILPSIKYSPLPITKISPIVEQDDKVFFFGNISGEYLDESDDNRKVVGVHNLQTGETSYAVNYPWEYQHNWGGGLFRWVYADYNSKQREIVISFPASHSLWVYNIDNLEESKSFYAGSQMIASTKYLRSSKMIPIDLEAKTRHFAENHSYSRVIFDPFRNVYYRIAEKGTVYEGMVGWSKEISVIILDKSFKIIGETLSLIHI